MSVAYGEQQRQSAFGGGDARFGATAPSVSTDPRDLERQYHVVLQDSLGHPALGFRDGMWFRLTVSGPQGLQLRGAIRHCPHAAGSIVQITCWWMRENPLQPRSLDLATELALTVGELVRACPADGLGSTSGDLLPMAMAAAVAPGLPPALPTLPAAPLPAPSSSLPAPAAAAPVTTGSWFDPVDAGGTGGFPAVPPAPVLGQNPAPIPAAQQTTTLPAYQQARTPYPPSPQGYGSAAMTQAALPAADSRPPAAKAPAGQRSAAPRGYGDPNADWDRPAAGTGRRAAPQPTQQYPAPGQSHAAPQPPRPAGPPRSGGPVTGNGSGPQPRPRPQQGGRPDYRDTRDALPGRVGEPDLSRSGDRLDRSSDRLDRSSDRLDRSSDRLDRSSDRNDPRGGTGNQARRGANPRQPLPRGSMGQRPATRPGRPDY